MSASRTSLPRKPRKLEGRSRTSGTWPSTSRLRTTTVPGGVQGRRGRELFAARAARFGGRGPLPDSPIHVGRAGPRAVDPSIITEIQHPCATTRRHRRRRVSYKGVCLLRCSQRVDRVAEGAHVVAFAGDEHGLSISHDASIVIATGWCRRARAAWSVPNPRTSPRPSVARGVLVECPRVKRPQLERVFMILTENASRHGHRLAQHRLDFLTAIQSNKGRRVVEGC